jgi:N-acetyltransferase
MKHGSEIRLTAKIDGCDDLAVTDDGLFYAMPELTGSRIRLEPLRYEHAAGYLAAAGSDEDAAEIFR